MKNSAPSKDEAYKNIFSDVICKSLTSIVLSQDASLEYYKNELNKRKASEADFKRFSDLCADIVVRKAHSATDGNISKLSREECESIVEDSLEEAWSNFNKEK